MNCINTKSKEYVELLEASKLPSLLLEMRISQFQDKNGLDSFPKVEDIIQSNEVNATLKAVDILQSDKAKQIFEKGKKASWNLNKILTELQIPKDQKTLLLDLNIDDREELAIELASKYSYSVEIDTVNKSFNNYTVYNNIEDYKSNVEFNDEQFRLGNYDNLLDENDLIKPLKSFSVIDERGATVQYFDTREEAVTASNELNSNIIIKPTNYYENLTVPGGTNYTENEISTPLITPSIKGHAQFATDNGIGWFRSDEQAETILENYYVEYIEALNKYIVRSNLNNQISTIPGSYSTKESAQNQVNNLNKSSQIRKLREDVINSDGKTRRILELQSDLFQKGRDKKYIAGVKSDQGSLLREDELAFIEQNIGENLADNNENKFLQLLNKDSNWVTFFVKSIIQDSQKKGYEKVLFPTGDTIAKIEGLDHSEDKTLHPVRKFYDNQVLNVLKKQGYAPTVITDESGNTWNEIIIDETRDSSTIFFKQVDFSDVTSENVDSIFENTISTPTVTKIDNKNKELLFGDNLNTVTVDDALKNLIGSDVFESSKEVGFFLEQAMNLLNKSGAKLKLATKDLNKSIYDKFDSDSAMMYDSITNTIYVTDTALENFDSLTLASSLIHEVVHSTTVKAYFNPKTFDEKEFKAFIDKSYAQYKHLAVNRDENGKLMYGFTNQAEFIAEIFSNPEFRKELQTIEKTWWNQFIDNVRRLFGMSRSVLNNDLIKTAVIFEVVNEFATRDSSQWAGTRVFDPRYNKFSSDFFNKVNRPDSSTLQDKLDILTNTQLSNISSIIARASSSSKKGVKNKEFVVKVKQLDVAINKALKTNKLDAINHYTDFMISQIEHIFKIVNNSSTSSELEKLDTIERYKSYLGASDLLTPIMDTLNDTRVKDLSAEDKVIANAIQDKLTLISGAHEQIKSKFRTHTTQALRNELKHSYYSEKTIKDFRVKVAKDYPQNSPISKNEWVNQEVINRKAELDILIEKDINDVIDGLSVDIDGFDKNLLTSLNTKSRLIQIVAKVISKMKSKIDELVRNNDFILDKLHKDVVKQNGKYDITNLYDKSSSGEVFVKGKYKIEFRDKYINEYSKLLDEVNVLKEKHRAAGYQDFEINEFADVNNLYRKLDSWRKDNTITVDKIIYPHPKYKNDLKFNTAEKAIYDQFITLARNSEMVFGINNSLIKTNFNAEFFSLPYASVTSLERVMTGRVNIKDTVKQKISNITDWKIDDIDNNEAMYRQDGTRIFNIPINYRNNVLKFEDPDKYNQLLSEQSFDLLTLMRLEHYNQTNFSIKSKNEVILNAFIDISKDKDYLKTVAGTNNLVSNMFGAKTKYVTFKGVESNEYKRLQTIINQSLYNVFKEEAFNIAGKDVNKLVQSINKQTSFLGMTMNYFSAPVNVVNAEFQTFLIKVGKDIDSGKLREAHLAYAKDLPNILADAGRPTKHSLVNQLNLLTDVFGGLTHEQNDFIKDTILKGIADPHLLQIMQSGGEHMVQSVLNIALLKSIKVMNDKGQYINSKGDIAFGKDVASLFDMVDQDVDTKQVKFNDKFTYTDRSTVTTWKEGGLENVRLFIKKKIFDSMGEYDRNFATDIQKHWWGQLIMMYKKFIIPLGITRYRGVNKAFTKTSDLSEEDRHWNESLQEYEEGFYTTTFRFITRGLVQNLVKLKFDIISQDWNTLSDYEKSNIKKGIVEMSLLIMLQTAIVPLLVGMAGGADDDDNIVYLAMLSRRLEQELSFYTDPNDAYKVTKNPIASLNQIEALLNVGKFVISPGLWFSETKDGTPRVYKVLEKVAIPGSMRPDRDSKSILQGMNRGLLAPYEEGIFYKMVNN